MKKGLQIFGKEGADAIQKEMEQLHIMGVLIPQHKSSMTPQERKRVLQYLMFLKRKRCGRIKGRGCADGSELFWWNPSNYNAHVWDKEILWGILPR